MITYTQDKLARYRTAQPASGTNQTLAELDVGNPDEDDIDFVLHAFDSALPYLASIGSEAQWGTALFSKKPERRKQFTDSVQESYGLANTQHAEQSDVKRWQHMLVYEIKTPDDKWTRVAALGVSNRFPDYVPKDLASSDLRQATDYHYLNYLIADRRAGELAKGAAAQLVRYAEEQCKQHGKTTFYGDCWRGNNDGLMK